MNTNFKYSVIIEDKLGEKLSETIEKFNFEPLTKETANKLQKSLLRLLENEIPLYPEIIEDKESSTLTIVFKDKLNNYVNLIYKQILMTKID